MVACLHQPSHSASEPAATPELLAVAQSFSPFVEQADPATFLFSINALQRRIGPPRKIAAALFERLQEQKIEARVVIASTPDAAVLLARHANQKMTLALGQEAAALAPLPLAVLFAHDSTLPPEYLPVLQNWGLSRCGDLTSLPETGLVERFGSAGQRLRRLALGQLDRPLRLASLATPYEEQVQLEHPLDCVEPLLFLISRSLIALCERLRSRMSAAQTLTLALHLENKCLYRRKLELAIPLHESRAMLKLLQLDLERHPPQSAVVGFTLHVEPVAPRRVQHHLLLPSTPAPDKLQLTLARIAAFLGESNVGTPELLNTFRPDAFRLRAPSDNEVERRGAAQPCSTRGLRLALRVFRPPVSAEVSVKRHRPQYVASQPVTGAILEASGPWRSSGEWWIDSCWATEDWDIALEDGSLYCLFRNCQTHQWFLRGLYD